jgi:hypothetical protein
MMRGEFLLSQTLATETGRIFGVDVGNILRTAHSGGVLDQTRSGPQREGQCKHPMAFANDTRDGSLQANSFWVCSCDYVLFFVSAEWLLCCSRASTAITACSKICCRRTPSWKLQKRSAEHACTRDKRDRGAHPHILSDWIWCAARGC